MKKLFSETFFETQKPKCFKNFSKYGTQKNNEIEKYNPTKINDNKNYK